MVKKKTLIGIIGAVALGMSGCAERGYEVIKQQGTSSTVWVKDPLTGDTIPKTFLDSRDKNLQMGDSIYQRPGHNYLRVVPKEFQN